MERLYNLSHRLYKMSFPLLPRLITPLIRIEYGSCVPYQTEIGAPVSFVHKMGIVISRTATIGALVKIRHLVTIGLGGAAIEDDVQIGACVKIIGKICIRKKARIDANPVVINDVSPDATTVEIPARIVKATDIAW